MRSFLTLLIQTQCQFEYAEVKNPFLRNGKKRGRKKVREMADDGERTTVKEGGEVNDRGRKMKVGREMTRKIGMTGDGGREMTEKKR